FICGRPSPENVESSCSSRHRSREYNGSQEIRLQYLFSSNYSSFVIFSRPPPGGGRFPRNPSHFSVQSYGWRREGDSNPRGPYGPHALKACASRPTLSG